MIRCPLSAGAVVALGGWMTFLLASPRLASAQDADKVPAATDQHYALLFKYRDMVGKIRLLDQKTGRVRLRIVEERLVLGPPQVQVTVSQIPIVGPVKQLVVNSDVSTSKKQYDFDLKLKDGAPLRKMWLPLQLDAKGFPRVYTAQEKLRFAGANNGFPGYWAKAEDFRLNTPVRISLERPTATLVRSVSQFDPSAELLSGKRPIIKLMIALEPPPPQE